MPPLLFRPAKIQRWQFYLRHLDLDLAQVDVERLVEQRRHHDREGDHDRHHDRLQADPGQRPPIDVGALYFLGRDAAQIEQREAERRMQERRLHVDAEHDAEPDQRGIRPHHGRQHLLRDRRHHRQDDEGDLEEVEEERHEEDEEVDEDQEAPDAAGQRRQEMLEPYAAGDAEEHHREAGRADQDEGDHAGDAHGGLIALLDQVAQVGDADGLDADPYDREIGDGEGHLEDEVLAVEHRDDDADTGRDDADDQDLVAGRAEILVVDRRQHDGADRAHGAGFGRRGKSHHHGAEHDEDQHGGGDDAHQALLPQRPAGQRARLFWHRRHVARLDEAEQEGVAGEQHDLEHRRAPGAEIHVAHRLAELVGQHDQHQRRRHQLRDGAGGRQHAGDVAHVVAVADHHRHRDQRHGDDLRGDRAGDGAEDEADDDDGIAETAADRAEQLPHRVEHVLGQP